MREAAPTAGPELSAVIAAGGDSSRMGRDKAWLPLDGRPLLVRQIALARSPGPAEVFISGRADTDYATFGRTVDYLRISITDRCNLR
jgi:molybdopterin-guanine dinucleotide biosynthesis protein A